MYVRVVNRGTSAHYFWICILPILPCLLFFFFFSLCSFLCVFFERFSPDFVLRASLSLSKNICYSCRIFRCLDNSEIARSRSQLFSILIVLTKRKFRKIRRQVLEGKFTLFLSLDIITLIVF